MPELPEVETIRRSLEPYVTGRRITGLSIGDFSGVLGHLSISDAEAVLVGRSIACVRRRGKYLLLGLDDGSGIEIHLRMTGRLEVAENTAPPLRFQHLSMRLDDGSELRFADQRKFGRVFVRFSDPGLGLNEKLGPEPLGSDFTSTYLAGKLRGRRAPLKSLLLDQRIVAGIGNIYADEALYLARLHPGRPASTVTPEETEALVFAIKEVLQAGIDHRGTTFSSFRDGTGRTGENQHRLAVYGRGRKGEPCSHCGSQLNFVVLGQRTSNFCPRCQPSSVPSATGPDPFDS